MHAVAASWKGVELQRHPVSVRAEQPEVPRLLTRQVLWGRHPVSRRQRQQSKATYSAQAGVCATTKGTTAKTAAAYLTSMVMF